MFESLFGGLGGMGAGPRGQSFAGGRPGPDSPPENPFSGLFGGGGMGGMGGPGGMGAFRRMHTMGGMHGGMGGDDLGSGGGDQDRAARIRGFGASPLRKRASASAAAPRKVEIPLKVGRSVCLNAQEGPCWGHLPPCKGGGAFKVARA
jgi:hypothetical protein